MKKNLYKYAAMAIIVETLNDKAESLRHAAQYDIDRYKDSEDEMSSWTKDEIAKNQGMADFLDDFISKL